MRISVSPPAAEYVSEEDMSRSGAEDVPHRERLPSRAFVTLLRVTGLCALPGWPGHLWSGLLYALQTGLTYRLLRLSLLVFTSLRTAGTPLFQALFKSRYVAAPNLLQWLALTVGFLWGRRRYDAVLHDIFSALTDIEKLTTVAGKCKRAHRAGEYMWAAVLLLTTTYAIQGGLSAAPVCREKSALLCAYKLGETVLYGYNFLALELLVMKFAFVGLLVNSGFSDINRELEALASSGCEDAHLHGLGRLQRRLSDIFTRLTSDMTSELVLVMSYGILVEIVLALTAINLPSLEAGSLMRLLLPLSAALVALAGLCETCQLLLSRLGDCRDLLLQLEWQHPRLAGPCQLLLRSVSRDLETLGDLGLFSARRSTMLSVTSTIVTYIIVMAQFQHSESG
ncbi:hypothetical protein FJT64_024909 [Amphibalanus amphitrite]|uniref:Gustatory receptor n=1 Tax=Amphibalanus amphitrite TaxID=1232801 RepID=A0A6A4WKB6_AMPAM|nr:hypothetical protein FJT64_024909 [Amphibalanus amphitrite]